MPSSFATVNMAGPDSPTRVILLPVDGSSHAKRAFDWYLENLYRKGDTLKFVCVVEPVYTTPAIGLAVESSPLPDFSRVMQESIDKGKKLGQQCLLEAKKCEIPAQAFLHVDTKPGTALVKAIEDHHANVVVMGNRGVGVLRRTFLGSVSDYVLHHARIPVVIVPPADKSSEK